MSAEGGEARKLTDIPYGVSKPIWSPDGESILVTYDQLDRRADEPL